jgi:hypothetical protein
MNRRIFAPLVGFKSDSTRITKAITDASIVGGPVTAQAPGIVLPFPILPNTIASFVPRVNYTGGNGIGIRASNYGGQRMEEVAEGAAKNAALLATLEIVENTVPATTFAAYVKASTQALADIVNLEPFLDALLRRMVELQIDFEIVGQLSSVVATGTTVADRVASVAASVFAASNIRPDTVAFSPDAFLKAAAVDPFGVDVDSRYMGMNIAISYGLAANEFAVGPFAGYSLLAVREEATVTIGMAGTDFIDNMRTVLGEARGQWSTPDLAAFGIGTTA